MRGLFNLFRRAPRVRIAAVPPRPQVLIAQQCFAAMRQCLAPANARRHEGVAYLLGWTDGVRTVCVHAVRPVAVTGPTFFRVSAAEMARVVELAFKLRLQIVAQIHTHPGDAYHSDGDEDGANIRFDGFVSIVIPDYGVGLPRLTGWATYHHSDGRGWALLSPDQITLIAAGTTLDGR